jgi:8-oxo-dGTP pyrophosphatase MutT (NUDIX family)
VLFSDAQVVLIAIAGERWQLPKGRIERGETPAQAAQREVREETGVEGEILEPLSTIAFTYHQRSGRPVHKTVDYFLLRYVSGTVADFDPAEVSEAAWFPWQKARELLTFDNERSVLELAHRTWTDRVAAPTDSWHVSK